MAVTDRYNIEEIIFVCYKMHEDLIGGVYDHRANPEYPKYLTLARIALIPIFGDRVLAACNGYW